MAKKILSAVGAAVLALSIVACGGSQKSDTTMPANQPAATSPDQTGTAPAPGTAPTTGGNPCNAGGTTPQPGK